jgi:hypothetical protein
MLLLRKKGKIQARNIYGVNPGQLPGELEDEIAEIRRCEFRRTVDILDDDAWRGTDLAGSIEVIGRRHGHACRSQKSQ